jgi:hypothetical protein
VVVIENDPSKENALMQAGVLAAGASPGSTSRLSVRPLGLNQERTTVPEGQPTVNRSVLRDACAPKVLEKATLSYCCLPRPDFQFIRSTPSLDSQAFDSLKFVAVSGRKDGPLMNRMRRD